MRPVDRGAEPRKYTHYADAKQDLVNRFGCYCSYCERRISTNLAVEHIQAKSLAASLHLANEWTNFLLACVNCNSAKSARLIALDGVLLPDRDNTFAAFVYAETGMVDVAMPADCPVFALADATIELTGLNRYEYPEADEALLFSALERVGQRVQVWVQAKSARKDFDAGQALASRIASEAASAGFFSIWMAAFDGVADVRQAIIQAFPNTAADCFDLRTGVISPRPHNGLAHAGKI
jgi:uncharacterized protein (TIGR02646 family)